MAHGALAALAKELEARRLADLLRSYGMTRSDAERMDDEEWGTLARVVGTNAPTMETRALAIQALRRSR